jgi:hypothetical protein
MSQYDVLNEFYIDNLIDEVHENPCYAYLRTSRGAGSTHSEHVHVASFCHQLLPKLPS